MITMFLCEFSQYLTYIVAIYKLKNPIETGTGRKVSEVFPNYFHLLTQKVAVLVTHVNGTLVQLFFLP